MQDSSLQNSRKPLQTAVAVEPTKTGTQGESLPLRLLIVDDERRIQQAFQLMLEDYGYYIRTVGSAAEALALAATDNFDVAFLDHFIGKDRGLELMQQLSGAHPSMYFVMITANGNTELAVEALKRGASDYIPKPFTLADIIKSLDFILKKRELDQQKKDLLQTLERKVRERTMELESIHLEVLTTLAQALETRDFGTYGHCKRVSHYSRKIAERLELQEEEMHYLEIGALLHDVGKIGISDGILLKPASLNEEEWHSLKLHPTKGAEILKPLRYLEKAMPGILYHHENYDGSGYPAGLRGEEIPIVARIIAVADAWDVMRSDRPYRKALSHEAAMSELIKFSGKQFDPSVVSIMKQLV